MYLATKLVDISLLNFLMSKKSINFNIVNSLVNSHPGCTTKWSLMAGGRLLEKSTKKNRITGLTN